MSRPKRFRTSGFAPRVVYERPVEADALDQQHARTSVWRRKWFKVPEGPWPCEVCSEYLVTGAWAHRRVVRGEAFYRHPRCDLRDADGQVQHKPPAGDAA